jgi:hypothetical protein
MSFDIIFTLHDREQDVKFTLEPNNDIIPAGAVVEYLDEAGNVERREPLMKQDYKVYKGNSWLRDDWGWTYAGWARVVVTTDGPNPLFSGAFTLNHDAHHIQSRTDYLKTRHPLDPLVESGGEEFMVVWRDSDIADRHWAQELRPRDAFADEIMCPSDTLGFNILPGNPVNKMILDKGWGRWGSLGLGDLLSGGRSALQRRQTSDISGTSGNSAGVNLKTTIGNTDGCPKTRQVALMGVATDCTYTGDFDTESDARSNVIKQINTAYVRPVCI